MKMKINWKQLRSYWRVFGWRGPFYWVYGKKSNQQAEVTVNRLGNHAPIYLRLGTSDVRLFDEIFVRRVYDLPLAQPPQVIVDAGANIGLTSLYFAARYPHARILAIEPAGTNFGQLCKNVAAYPQITPIQAALWETTGELDLIHPTGLAGRYGTFRTWDVDSSRTPALERIPAITISDLLATYRLTAIDLLKVDIEGAEVELFSHASGWIDRAGVIVIELHDRFRRGCALNFYNATQSFEREWHRGELVVVARTGMMDT